MILYLDASALVKRYVQEAGSAEVEVLIAQAALVGTGLVTRAELAAALSKAVRVKALTGDEAAKALKIFRAQWNDFAHIQITETLMAKADALAWEYGLRGYDAVHLAAAFTWQEAMDEAVVLATFDKQLWAAGQKAGLRVWPETL